MDVDLTTSLWPHSRATEPKEANVEFNKDKATHEGVSPRSHLRRSILCPGFAAFARLYTYIEPHTITCTRIQARPFYFLPAPRNPRSFSRMGRGVLGKEIIAQCCIGREMRVARGMRKSSAQSNDQHLHQP